MLLKNRGGTVTLFAFDTGEGLREHTAPFEALVVNVEGHAEVEIAGNSFRVGPGETTFTYLTNNEARHSIRLFWVSAIRDRPGYFPR